ncbi:poly [ADP-ribose] polymerase-like [Contarinia nasturtii]|uniref:poly [ADP-ribose] polymerase-like n=1 Tax=Contarinia nasturtii TaxID=265458 RepID=UPI0012D3DD5E|nr:poly [ADP-ribose] polymerase-like [Contarinia nasturtii]
MENSLPYKVTYSTGNQICNKCHTQILLNCLQIAVMTQSVEDDFRFPVWHHKICFFTSYLPQTVAAFDGFTKLRYIDQIAIKECIGIFEPENVTQEYKLSDFWISRGPTRDSCAGCDKKISQSEIQIMKIVLDTSDTVGKATWWHAICFVRTGSHLGWPLSADLLPGFKRLGEEDKDAVKHQMPYGALRRIFKPPKQKDDVEMVIEMDIEMDVETDVEMEEVEKIIEKQNMEYYKLYDKLARNVSKKYQIEFLKENNQMVPKTDSDILHQLTDVIMFGALKPCKICEHERMIFGNSAYVCAYTNDWGKCGWETREPERYPVKIHKKFTNKYPSLKIKPSVRQRVYNVFRLTDENGTDLIYAHDCESEIVEANDFEMEVDSEKHLAEGKETQKNGPFLSVKTKCMREWAGDERARIEMIGKNMKKDEDYTNLLPEKITFKVTGGRAIDPGCHEFDLNLNRMRVYSCKLDKGELEYTAVLGLVDIENNRNSYYRMQLLVEHITISTFHSVFWVFETWGRISTVIGSKRLQLFETIEEARTTFNTIYEEKTGNPFELKQFIKWPEKYYHLEIDLGLKPKVPLKSFPTKLNPPLFQLMQIIFNINQMENVMIGCDVDLKQMPLGKISAQGIRSAMNVLRHIEQSISQNNSYSQLREASNKFYTLIPHAFGIKRPPVIDSMEVVIAKNEMLESLLNMELIYRFLDEENGEKMNILDACYLRLKTDIVAVNKNSAVFKKLVDIIKTTHGPTHDNFTLEVLEIFKVRRHGEDNRFEKWKDVSTQLLWHGSSSMNFVSILANGLKVAPPEAKHNGDMFGEGIYFTDVVSKATNYCQAQKTDNIGFVLLCEVAIGQVRCLYESNKIEDHIPNDTYQSVQGCGQYQTSKNSKINGKLIKTGKLIKKRFITSLTYNEFVVYDPGQVKIEYMIKLKFNYTEKKNFP